MPENDTTREMERRTLWAHLVSEHAGLWSTEASLDTLLAAHRHEHDGPGTIRNHREDNRFWSPEKLVRVLGESLLDEASQSPAPPAATAKVAGGTVARAVYEAAQDTDERGPWERLHPGVRETIISAALRAAKQVGYVLDPTPKIEVGQRFLHSQEFRSLTSGSGVQTVEVAYIINRVEPSKGHLRIDAISVGEAVRRRDNLNDLLQGKAATS